MKRIETLLNPGFEGVRQVRIKDADIPVVFAEGKSQPMTDDVAKAFIDQNQKKVGEKKIYGVIEFEDPASVKSSAENSADKPAADKGGKK